MTYPGLAIIGCDDLAGIYGVNEGITDAKGTGIQHLFHRGFGKDLVHSAVTLIKDGDNIYYGNRSENKGRHPVHLRPVSSEAKRGYIFTDSFECGGFSKSESAFSWGRANIGFDVEIKNNSNEKRELEIYAYVILRPQAKRHIKRNGDYVVASGSDSNIRVQFPGAELCSMLQEGPTGFIYRLTNSVLRDQMADEPLNAGADMLCGILLGKKVILPANGKINSSWSMGFSDDSSSLENNIITPSQLTNNEIATRYWESYLSLGSNVKGKFKKLDRVNQVAIKSAIIAGFVPADLTGHYYANGLPCYYARDALMVARAFMSSGHLTEARQIIKYLQNREQKPSGEFYQRYDGNGNPSEGANNNVSRQLDSIGYFLRIVHDFERLSGERLVTNAEVANLAKVIIQAEKKNGLVGPEGGVNEGVFGPAFIVSSNMFIYGGLSAAIELIGEHPIINKIRQTLADILAGIESTFVEGEGYKYGYVTYHDDLIYKYDTPQYFGLLYGFPDTKNMRTTHQHLLRNASFFEHGIGYSEQEYHHGPWSFNTAACAQYAFKIGDLDTYKNKLLWLKNHCNAYGLMPEAFSADNSGQCYINPLVWACAEIVSALHLEDMR